MNAYLIGIDVGTSGVKSELYTADGICIASRTVEYPMYQPQNGWAESSCEDWWRAVTESLQVIFAALPEDGTVAGIGLSGQMHSLVLLDADYRPLRNAILWCDTRSEAECRIIEDTVGKETLLRITANAALPGFTLSKILWVKHHEPQVFSKIAHILLPKDYIRFRLTGVLATEYSDAAGTQLLDLQERKWSQELTDAFGIDLAWFPTLYDSAEVTGTLTHAAAQATGLPEGTPVVGGAADNAAAAVGTGCIRRGESYLTIGTSGVLFTHTGEAVTDPSARCHTFCSAVKGEYYMMGVTQAAGLSLQWLSRQLFPQLRTEALEAGENIYAYLDRLAAASPLGANRLLYLPYLMGERTPYLDGELRGMLFGLSAIHTQADIIRAVLEGVAFSQRNCLSVLRENGLEPTDIRICGGGAKSPIWRQIFADVLGKSLSYSPKDAGGAVSGVAILAGVGTGIYADVYKGCAAFARPLSIQENDFTRSASYEKLYSIFHALYGQIADLSHRLFHESIDIF